MGEIGTLVALSAPTVLAVRLAETAGLTLIGLAASAAPVAFVDARGTRRGTWSRATAGPCIVHGAELNEAALAAGHLGAPYPVPEIDQDQEHLIQPDLCSIERA